MKEKTKQKKYFFKIIILSVLMLFLFLFFSNTFLFNSLKLKSIIKTKEKFCYVSLLCDDAMIDAAVTMLYSFQKTKSPYPFVMLVLPDVTQTNILERIGANLIRIQQVEYPTRFKKTKDKQKTNKMCRYSKLHIWRLTMFQKAIFVDIDTLFVKNTDEVFKNKRLSAVSDLGDTFNTGFFLFKPSISKYDRMISVYQKTDSYNQGDQGFINTFFSNQHTTRLSSEFNTMCKSRFYSLWNVSKTEARLLHYTSETKPWNFFYLSHKSFYENFDVEFYYRWQSFFFSTQRFLSRGVFSDPGPLWKNLFRRNEICDKEIDLYPNINKKGSSEHISVIVFKWTSSYSLDHLLIHLRTVAPHLIDRIYVLWRPSIDLPDVLLSKYEMLNQKTELPEVIFIRQKHETPNGIFNPIGSIRTRSVLYTTDQFLPDTDWIELAFHTWKGNEQAIVGAYPHYHGKKETAESTGRGKFRLEEVTIHYGVINLKTPRPYTLISSTGMLISVEYLFIYTCLLPLEVHLLIDRSEDGADIAMNMLVSGMTEQKPVLVLPHGKKNIEIKGADKETIDEYQGIDVYTKEPAYIGQYSSINGLTFHQRRARIMRELFYLFGNKDPLQQNNFSVSQFTKIPFRKKSPKQWHNSK